MLRSPFSEAVSVAVESAARRQFDGPLVVLGSENYWTRVLEQAQAAAKDRAAGRPSVAERYPHFKLSLSSIPIVGLLSYLGSVPPEELFLDVDRRIVALEAAAKAAGSDEDLKDNLDLQDLRERFAGTGMTWSKNLIHLFQAWVGVIMDVIMFFAPRRGPEN